MKFINAIRLLCGILLASAASVFVSQPVSGQVLAINSAEDLRLLDLQSGSNVNASLVPFTLEGGATAAEIVLEKKNPLDDAASQNWYWLALNVPADLNWKDADRLMLEMSLSVDSPRYLVVELITKSGSRFRAPLTQGAQPWSRMSQRVVPLSRFRNPSDRQARLAAADVSQLRIGGRAEAATLRLQSIALGFAKKKSADGWLSVDVKSNIPSPLFERGEAIQLSFRNRSGIPAGVRAVTLEVVNDLGEHVFSKTLERSALQEGATVTIDSLPVGYYELRAYAETDQGRGRDSCIVALGQLPQGVRTFAVMPATVEENMERMERIGENAFFGIHGIKYEQQMDRLIGVPWSIQYSRWRREEPVQGHSLLAQRSGGIVAEEPWRLAITSFAENNRSSVPRWWLEREAQNAPIYRDPDYLEYVRSYTRAHAERFPHMEQRVYDGAWEIGLNRPGWYEPYFTEAEVVDYYKHVAEVIRSEDPRAFIIGPCAHTFMTWIETLFKEGLLDVVDGISTHFYCSPPPESIHADLLKLKALIKQYNGEPLQIWNTEAGFRSIREDGSVESEHAAWVVRYNLILKGEGVAKNLTFYTIDFDSGKPGANDSWGLGYNMDEKFSYNPSAIAPKQAMLAYAVCVDQLMEAEPVGSLNWLDNAIWGYVFSERDVPILALWRPDGVQQMALPVGSVESVTVTDMMGRATVLTPVDGMVQLELGPNPIYVRGASAALYGKGAVQPDAPVHLYPGQTRKLQLADAGEAFSVLATSAEGVRVIEQTADGMLVGIGSSVPAGAQSILLSSTGADGTVAERVLWLSIGEALEIRQVIPEQRDGILGMRVSLVQYGDLNEKINARGRIATGVWAQATSIEQQGDTTELFIPLLTKGSTMTQEKLSIKAELQILRPDLADITWTGDLYLLAATQSGEPAPSPFRNRALIQSPEGADVAEVLFHWSASGLTLSITVNDGVHRQTFGGEQAWREDSIQLAFDTDPEHAYPYDFMTGNLLKRISEITLSSGTNGAAVWRHLSYNVDVLPLGDATGRGIQVEWTRETVGDAEVSHYRVHIPWSEIGFGHAPAEGKLLGISILVNDSNAAGVRATYPLFGGIDGVKDATRYGRLLLLP